jgi:hypothetical protein
MLPSRGTIETGFKALRAATRAGGPSGEAAGLQFGSKPPPGACTLPHVRDHILTRAHAPTSAGPPEGDSSDTFAVLLACVSGFSSFVHAFAFTFRRQRSALIAGTGSPSVEPLQGRRTNRRRGTVVFRIRCNTSPSVSRSASADARLQFAVRESKDKAAP